MWERNGPIEFDNHYSGDDDRSGNDDNAVNDDGRVDHYGTDDDHRWFDVHIHRAVDNRRDHNLLELIVEQFEFDIDQLVDHH